MSGVKGCRKRFGSQSQRGTGFTGLLTLLGGSWVVINGVISRVTIPKTRIRDLEPHLYLPKP